MSRPYQRKSSQQWQTLVNNQWQSGLSAAKFCEQNDIGYASFCKWKQRLAASQDDNNDPGDAAFIDLGSVAAGVHKWHITLSLGDGVELTLSRD